MKNKMEVAVGARVPLNVVRGIDYVAREENVVKSKVIRELLSGAIRNKLIDLALDKYSKKLVSLGRAAELGRVPLADFMKIASDRKIAVNYSVESLEEDFSAAAK